MRILRYLLPALFAMCPMAHAGQGETAGTPRSATGMTAVPEDTGLCGTREDTSAICHEWVLTADPSLRFVAYGYEDGIESAFYERMADGEYEHRLRVLPVMRDGAQPGKLFWVYPWDIRDLALPVGGDGMLATYDHDLVDESEAYTPAWQKRIPVVLFEGVPTPSAVEIPLLVLEPLTLDDLRSSAAIAGAEVTQAVPEKLLVTGFPGLPADARFVVERLASCNHFWGEPTDNWPERRLEIGRILAELDCANVMDHAEKIRNKYRGNREVHDALDAANGF